MALLDGSADAGLLTVDSRDVTAVIAALRDALAGGPAVLPRDADLHPADGAGDAAASLAAELADFGDAALVIETSGSTGTPKRVALSAAALRASAEATYAWCDASFGGEPNSRQWLLCLPAHYIAGAQVLVRSILAGTDPVQLTGHFSSAAFVAAAEKLTAEARYTSLVPVQLQRLLATVTDEPGSALATEVDRVMRGFTAVLVGGQSTPRQQLEAARDRGWPVVTTYGASETAGGCVYNGEPLPGVRVRAVDGEIWLGGDQLALGYLGDPERQAQTFVMLDGQRWYRTSDFGALLEEDGRRRIQLTGRMDQVIISGGEKVHLGVVERLVQAVPGFEQAVAVAVPHPEWGQSVAVVVPRGAVAGGASEAIELPIPAQLREATAKAGRAARIQLLLEVDALPRLGSGKPDRIRLAEIAAAHQTIRD